MAQDQELIGLQNDLAKNLEWQEIKKGLIKEVEQELITLENQQAELEQDIIDLLGVIDEEQEQGNEESFNNILSDIANDMLQGINVDLDKNEQGETIQ
jgi:hypothetical protein